MSCQCGSEIRSCAPYASAADVRRVLDSICAPCKGTVPFGTDPSDFITQGFPNGAGECCELLFVEVLGQNPGDDSLFFISSDGVLWTPVGADNAVCVVEVPALTPPANFVTVGFGGTVPSSCQTAWVYYDDASAIYVSPDAGTTWYRVSPRNFTAATRTGSTTSSTFVKIGATVSATAVDTAVHIIVSGSVDWTASTGANDNVRFRLDVNGSPVRTYAMVEGGGSRANAMNIATYYIHPCAVADVVNVELYIAKSSAVAAATLNAQVQMGV